MQEVIVTKKRTRSRTVHSKIRGCFILTDSLTGILKGDYDLYEVKSERLREKYEVAE